MGASLLLLLAPGVVQAFEVDAANSVIVVPTDAAPLTQTAAAELQKHLQLVTGVEVRIVAGGDVPGETYVFHVGIPSPDDKQPLAAEEARWSVTPDTTHLWGNDDKQKGTLFAVYGFLEDQLGIRWIEPGDVGIAYRKQSPLALQAGDFRWIPRLAFRSIRQGLRKDQLHRPKGIPETDAFLISAAEHNAKVEDVLEWRNRMRMGGTRLGGSHAFSTWWKKYGTSHPEYFALNRFGKREPVPLPKAEQTEEFVKICPSNPQVADRVVQNWLPKKEQLPSADTGVNDGSDHFCECESCRALDVPRPGEKPMAHLTDRYVHLSNRVAREVRKHRPDAFVTMYAYLRTLLPPRALKLEPNVLVQLVPYVDPLDVDIAREHLEGWKNAGATRIAFRPNYHTKYMTTVLPLGLEKQMFDVFQVAVANGCVTAEYDSLVNNWPVTGITDYILAKAMSDPSQPFDHWEDHYCQGYGAAAPEVKDYFRHWRNEVWEQRLRPNMGRISNAGGAGDFARGLQWNLGAYFKLEDFHTAAAILDRGAAKQLTAAETDRLNQLRWANEHARLFYQSVVATPEDKAMFADALTAFRKRHKDDLRLLWVMVIGGEINNGDITGLRVAKEMQGYLKPWLKSELFWKFRLDPQDVGVRQKWQSQSWEAMADWSDFRTDRFWEQQFEFDEPNTLPEDTAKLISNYDGIAWYATRQPVPSDWKGRNVFLRFGGVDESCQVYVNGELAAERIYQNKNDWKTPFEIRIDPLIDWSRDRQSIVVRVEDRGGGGGIWRPVWVVSKQP